MASFVLRLPTGNLRSFSVHSSSNGAPPGSGSQNGGPMILELPLDKIRRPLMRTRSNDPNKVQELMHSIRQIGLQVPGNEDNKECRGNKWQIFAKTIIQKTRNKGNMCSWQFSLPGEN
ncbi:hypothetical protein E1A91_D02G004600v1 [Gossypium mustelinum]|uniref:Sulfiredoxin n=1 Tax=Gossypium mustelinum TaxID=34275 RepID=A0A5D2VQU6_GOSMU|nr:hypothetical protein E1A91_D02G004600v1 [Gossypium mustelinum]